MGGLSKVGSNRLEHDHAFYLDPIWWRIRPRVRGLVRSRHGDADAVWRHSCVSRPLIPRFSQAAIQSFGLAWAACKQLDRTHVGPQIFSLNLLLRRVGVRTAQQQPHSSFGFQEYSSANPNYPFK